MKNMQRFIFLCLACCVVTTTYAETLQEKNDKALMEKYINAEDIIRERDKKIKIIQDSIGITQGNLNKLNIQMKKLLDTLDQIEKDGTGSVPDLNRQISELREQIINNQVYLDGKKQEQQAIQQQSDADYARLQILQTNRTVDVEPIVQLITESSQVFVCPDKKNCDHSWEVAKQYIERYATTPIDHANDLEIATKKPEKDKDISMKATRKMLDDNTGEISIQVNCSLTDKGDDLCSGYNGSTLKEKFFYYLKRGRLGGIKSGRDPRIKLKRLSPDSDLSTDSNSSIDSESKTESSESDQSTETAP